MTRPGPDYPHKRPRQTANSDVGAPPQAGASIVIPIRLQVTGPTLAEIEAFKDVYEQAILKASDVRRTIANHYSITIHETRIDRETA